VQGERRRTRIPDLGPRGEGWVLGQLIVLGVVAVAGVQHLPQVAIDGWFSLGVLVVGVAEMLLGGWAVASAFRELGPNLTPVPRPSDGGTLIQTGIYLHVRHPIYAGLLLGSIGWATVTRSPVAFVAAIALFGLLDLKARREEGWLLDRYPDYEAYIARTKRFLPRIY